MLKNPYFHSFNVILTLMLKAQARKREESGVSEMIEVLFDENMEKIQRLKVGFAGFVSGLETASGIS